MGKLDRSYIFVGRLPCPFRHWRIAHTRAIEVKLYKSINILGTEIIFVRGSVKFVPAAALPLLTKLAYNILAITYKYYSRAE